MSETVQFVLLTWQALTPTIGMFLWSVTIPVTTVPCASAGRDVTDIRIIAESRPASKSNLFTASLLVNGLSGADSFPVPPAPANVSLLLKSGSGFRNAAQMY